LVAELLTSAEPVQAKYLVRTVLEDMRIGLGEGTIRDSIVWAFFMEDAGIEYNEEKNKVEYAKGREVFDKYAVAVQDGINLTNDVAVVAITAKNGGIEALSKIKLHSGTPIKVMLYLKAKDIADAFKIVGKPAAIEYKYDGFRVQIHKKDGKISVFTRRLEDVTKQFPDVVKYVEEHIKADSFIIEGEAVGYDPSTKKYVAFQNVSQRIKRKYDIEQIAQKMPVEVNLFDIIQLGEKNLLNEPFTERRKLLESIMQNPVPLKIVLAKQLITDDEEKARKMYEESLAAGNEGIMMKKLDGNYNPGARVGLGVKVKPVMDSLEVVIVGAEWGEGKRGAWLASFIIGVRDNDTGEILGIGRVGTGFKEKEEEGVNFNQMTELLKPLVTKTAGRIVTVKPKIVIEVKYEEIQASPTYSSKYALRFPRFVKLREDRGVDDINSIQDVRELYSGQRGRNA